MFLKCEKNSGPEMVNVRLIYDFTNIKLPRFNLRTVETTGASSAPCRAQPFQVRDEPSIRRMLDRFRGKCRYCAALVARAEVLFTSATARCVRVLRRARLLLSASKREEGMRHLQESTATGYGRTSKAPPKQVKYSVDCNIK